MDAPTATSGPTATSVPTADRTLRRRRLTTLTVMVVTAVVIATVAVAMNQRATTANGVTDVTIAGDPTGAAPTIGQPAPDFAATTVDGKAVRLSDFRGQPVWLTFGASWCQPCRAENPDIKATAERFAPQGLVVLAVFISEDDAAVADYADRIGLGYLKVADPDTAIASKYRILGIPSHFFIDRDGVLRVMKVGSLDVAGMERAIGELQP
jgi:cytochrome c biogenesis protein CcmG/thiol:disulfide interchange protein DsbE